MLNKSIIIACLFVTSAFAASAQGLLEGTRLRLVDDGQTYGAQLLAPTPASADEFYILPDVGGYLLVGDGTGNPAWMVGGQNTTGTALIGSKNAFDVQLVAGPSMTPRVVLPNAAKLVTLPDQTEIRLYEAAVDGSEYTAFKAPTQAFDVTIFLPTVVGPAGARLTVASATANTNVTTWQAP